MQYSDTPECFDFKRILLAAMVALFLLGNNVVGWHFAGAGLLPAQDEDPRAGQTQERFASIAESEPPETVDRDPGFEERLDAWKQTTLEVMKVRDQFNICAYNEAEGVRKQWRSLVEQGEANIAELYRYGIDIYEKRGVADPRIGSFLMQRAIIDVEILNYTRANRVFQALEASGLKIHPEMLRPAGLAAYTQNDFEQAKEYLDAAAGLKILEPATTAFSIRNNLPKVIEGWMQEQNWRRLEKSKDDLPIATIVTSLGEIKVELFENDAPNTVASFINLAENGFYDDNFFFLTNDMFAGTGMSTFDGEGTPPYSIPQETSKQLYRPIFRGSLIMLREAKGGNNNTRFAICRRPLSPNNYGEITCFGRVLAGMDVVDGLLSAQLAGSIQTADRVERIDILRKRDHEYTVKKVED